MVRLDSLEVRRNDPIIERGQAMNAWPLEIAVEDKARNSEPCSHQVIFVFFSASTEPGRKVLAVLGSHRPLIKIIDSSRTRVNSGRSPVAQILGRDRPLNVLSAKMAQNSRQPMPPRVFRPLPYPGRRYARSPERNNHPQPLHHLRPPRAVRPDGQRRACASSWPGATPASSETSTLAGVATMAIW